MYTLHKAAVVLLLSASALADFHISYTQWLFLGNDITQYAACPSNYYKCACYGPSQDRAAVVYNGNPSKSFFKLNKGLCGMGQLDFYKQSDGTTWKFYISGGDGSVQGTCYKNTANWGCLSGGTAVTVSDSLVCYSYVCGSASKDAREFVGNEIALELDAQGS